ncbi:PREDICTED: myohemerythrin-1-like [Priapulus caudatus]|uniref:Myohemerythrin-1-like n=1 Tax=Priapulus caudatus TaxID=37621 RepID=A0ABM1ETJ4_PRICU|nr:PREDICTED: myohemerythrin-1-like [Priapulus caudatus]
MGFEIPEPYCWDESFKVFYEQIDDEHKGLFKGIFEVAGDRSNAAKLKSLQGLIGAHFKFEEGMMIAAKYGNYDSHKKIHEEFIAKLGAVTCPVNDEGINWAKEWLVSHIKTIDFQYKGKL